MTACIVGWAHSPFGKLTGETLESLIVKVAVEALVAAGVPVTINSDDPPMFSTTLNHEYEIAAELLQLDAAGIAELAKAAVRAAFLDAAGKTALLSEIDEYETVFGG